MPGYIHRTEVQLAANQIGVDASALTAIDDAEELQVGRVRLRVLHTPGHSPGSVVLIVSIDDIERLVLTADTLFPGSCGRLDLPGSSIDEMYSSTRKLAALDERLPMFPGHAYSGEESTIAQEKQSGLLRAELSRTSFRQMMAR